MAAKAGISLNDLLFTDDDDRKSYDTIKWVNKKSGRDAANGIRNLLGELIHEPASTPTKEKLKAAYLTKADTAPHAAARGVAFPA